MYPSEAEFGEVKKAIPSLSRFEHVDDVAGLQKGFDALCQKLKPSSDEKELLFYGFTQSPPQSAIKTAFAMQYTIACCEDAGDLSRTNAYTTVSQIAQNAEERNVFPDLWDRFVTALDQKDPPSLWKAFPEEADNIGLGAYGAMRWALAHGRAGTDPTDKDFRNAVYVAEGLSSALPEDLRPLDVGPYASSKNELKAKFRALLEDRDHPDLWGKAYKGSLSGSVREQSYYAMKKALACFARQHDPAPTAFRQTIAFAMEVPETRLPSELLPLRKTVLQKLEDVNHPNLWLGAFEGAKSPLEGDVYAVKRVLAYEGRGDLEGDGHLSEAVGCAAENISFLSDPPRVLRELRDKFVGMLQRKNDLSLLALAAERASGDTRAKLSYALVNAVALRVKDPEQRRALSELFFSPQPAPLRPGSGAPSSSKFGGPSGAGTA